ncbi:diaminopimelate epimerase [Prochlorococcus marinus]|uniref:diaminopimelate epimerase n=1 Tax=Prochlorococcus marinus TaxID=1219 RepID=UPI0007B3EF83|nr:diaminopimelate epimerase [Prochlorococcus marinus]KZR76055.1 Diaminopimelate epimerase [Prochlorococcus marinus str. MIT 1320]
MLVMLQFSKYQGLGNDFLLIDGREDQLTQQVINPDPAWVRKICDRHFGIGADGLILALPPRADGDLRMQIFNADGSLAEMCGNGIRCLTRFLADIEGDLCVQRWNIETLAGIICPILQEDGQICVDMGSPFLDPESIPTTLTIGSAGLPQGECHLGGTSLHVAAVGMGNPHVIVPVEDLESIPFENWGKRLEKHHAFPAKTNVHFLKIHSPNQLEIRVWERGSGPTLACGTGACASLVAACLLGLSDDHAEVLLPGGGLQIRWPGRRGSVFMTGPAEPIFDGVLTPLLSPSHAEVLPQDNQII